MEMLVQIIAIVGVAAGAFVTGVGVGRRNKETVLMAIDSLLQTDAIASTYMGVDRRHDATIQRLNQIRSEYASGLVRRRS